MRRGVRGSKKPRTAVTSDNIFVNGYKAHPVLVIQFFRYQVLLKGPAPPVVLSRVVCEF
jgi:hypothetical protein